ncbi:MAG: hypothetical protein K7J46_01190 [Bryobacter sp.]|nr:hypothetical protein [Bryobacter sp. CoA8 C33]
MGFDAEISAPLCTDSPATTRAMIALAALRALAAEDSLPQSQEGDFGQRFSLRHNPAPPWTL